MPAEILILGGGFAGLAAAEELASRWGSKRYRIRLLDRRHENVFAPLLPDLISARVRGEHIAYALEPCLKRMGVEYIHGNVKAIHPKEGRVETFEGEHRADYIIICLGCDTNYFGDEHIKRHSVGLKWIEEGVTINVRATKMIDSAKADGETANFLVVGGGYTGIEAASHLAYLAKVKTGLPYGETERFARVIIAEKTNRILSSLSDKSRGWAAELVRSYGIEIVTNATVQKFADGDNATLTNGTVIHRPLVLWTAGVAPGPAVAAMDAPKEHGDRLAVDKYLRLPGSESVFAAGDVACARTRGHKEGLRMAVQFSLVSGRIAAENVKRTIEGRPLKEFDPVDPGYLVPLAPGHAAGVVLGHESKGLTPFLLHYFMSLVRSRGRHNRLSIFGDLWKELVTDER